jgi:endonuclease/exonuclease/phosphatase family metal-dependent hydrolase
MLAGLAGAAFADEVRPPARGSIRIATFNVQELSRAKLDERGATGFGKNPQLLKAAEIIRRIRPDIVLLNEIDFDTAKSNARLFVERYLHAPAEGGPEPIHYEHILQEPTNTGHPSGLDFDNDGKTDGPADAWGYGKYPGQYGMALLSRFPIDRDGLRSFQRFLWKDMPKNLMPDGQDGKPPFYNAEEREVFRLSSKSHWVVPVVVPGRRLELLACHPTPPIFDGPEDSNGRRNWDEVRLIADLLTGGATAEYLVDDQGRRGGLAASASFVILGDLNTDPLKGDPIEGKRAASMILGHPRVQDPTPSSAGGAEDEKSASGAPKFFERKTSRFGRIDYALPSRDLKVTGGGLFWPTKADPLRRLVSDPDPSSDHRMVWVDLDVGPSAEGLGEAPAHERVEVKEIGETLDRWHLAAAKADLDGYFGLIHPKGVFLGTDATERWEKPAFLEFSKPHFAKGKAWAFRATRRAVELNDAGDLAWFDEDLATENLGPCRGTGVVVKTAEGWRIRHYSLTATIPNERFKEVKALLETPKPAPPTNRPAGSLR